MEAEVSGNCCSGGEHSSLAIAAAGEAKSMPTAAKEIRSEVQNHPPADTRQKDEARFWIALVGMVVALAFVIIFATAVGSVQVGLRSIVCMLLNHCGLIHLPQTWSPSDESIILQIRMPRVIGAALVGAALSVAGTLFQGLLRNPMADPYVIGTSGGAALGATIGIFLVGEFATAPFSVVPVLAFCGALATMALVYWLSRVGGRTPVVTLLLAGFAISVILGYTVSFLLIISDRLQLNMRVVYAWLLGGISVAPWSQIGLVAVIVVACTALAISLGGNLNALSLGDESAEYLGVHVDRQRAAIIVLGSVLTAAAVSVGGLIGFVGLIVPHTMRLLFGPDHTRLLPLAAFGGATFLVLADLVARVVLAPTELPVGILTAFIGGPAFLLLLRHSKHEYRF